MFLLTCREINKNDLETKMLYCKAAYVFPCSFLQKSNRGIAMLALEGLSNKSSNMQQVLTALRCLTRLKLTVLSSQDGSR